MRAIIELTEKEKKELKILKNKTKNNKIYRRYLYVGMSSEGMTNLEISSFLGVCNDTLTDWKDIFEEAGLSGLSQLKYEGRRESKLNAHKEKIKEKVNKEMIRNLKEMQHFLKTECKIEVEQSWLSRYCKKNSIFLIKKPA